MTKILPATLITGLLLHASLFATRIETLTPATPNFPRWIRTGFDADEAERHKTVARERAEDYFQFEYPLGSVRVTAVKFAVEETEWVQGWTGRYRTYGKAYLEFFDSQTRTFQRLMRKAEIVTEEKENHVIKVQHFLVRP